MTDRLVVPLRRRRTSQFADAGLVANVWLWVCEDVHRENHLGAYHRRLFRVDTGSSQSSVSMDLAREIGVTIPVLESTTSLLTAVGRRAAVIRHGVLLVRFAGMERHAFVMSCAFHEARPLEVPPLPGLDAIRPQRGRPLRWTFDGNPTDETPEGRLIIEVAPLRS